MYDDDDFPVLVVDNGSCMLRAGFAGDDDPRVKFPAVVGTPKHSDFLVGLGYKDSYIGNEAQKKREILAIKHPIEHGIITRWNEMEELWDHTFCNELKVKPEEQSSILLSEPPRNPKRNREKMAEIMLETFNFPSVSVAMHPILSLMNSGRGSGIVIDSGEGQTHILPVYEGRLISNGINTVNIVGGDLTEHLRRLLNKRGYNFYSSSDQDVVRTIKEKVCYVASNVNPTDPKKVDDSDMPYELPDGQRITVRNERYLCPEAFFQPILLGKQELGVHECLYNSLMKCDIDTRRDLFCNIILSGGNTMFTGIGERLQQEISALLPPTVKSKVLSIPERELSVWIGGSILASLTAYRQQAVSKADYDETGPSVIHTKSVNCSY